MVRVKFYTGNSTDPITINSDYIIELKQSCNPYGESLKLGLTICRVFKISILRQAFDNQYVGPSPPSLTPSRVLITEDDSGSEVDYATLNVDSRDDTNEAYYTFTCVDYMMKLANGSFDWNSGDNVYTVIQTMCSHYGVNFYGLGASLPRHRVAMQAPVPYVAGINGRDFLRYVGEIGAYNFHFTGDGRLYVDAVPSGNMSISKDECSSYKLGNRHQIARLVYDNGLEKYQYPSGSVSGDTLYIDPNNILLGGDNTQTLVNNAGSYGATSIDVYDIDVEQCPVLPDVVPGSVITIGGNKTFATIDWTYNGGWIGGYHFKVDTSLQEETQVINPVQREIAKVGVTINRQNGIIDLYGEKVDELEKNNIHFQVDAQKSEVRVTNQDTYEPTAYTSFKGDGMRIYTPDDTEPVASATAERFECHKGLGVQDWSIEQQQGNPNVLIFFRRD